MIELFTIVACAALNHIRGGWLDIPADRIIASLGVGSVYTLLTLSPLAGAIVAVGFYLWALKGWGLYFASGHGEWARDEVEIKWIDRIGLKLFPLITVHKHPDNFKRGVLCMGLRGGAYSLPLFLGLSYVHGLEAMLVWPLFFLQGVAYYIAGRININFVWIAEIIWGACIGTMLVIVGS